MGLFDFHRDIQKPVQPGFANEPRLRKQSTITAHRQLYKQHDFMQLLYLERRRSERSSRALCLILLELSDDPSRESAFQRVFQALRSSIRETDVIGWYQQNCTLAIMFSDLNYYGKTVIDTLRGKVCAAANVSLMPALLKQVRISVHVFPKQHSDEGADLTDLTFYPDLPSQFPDHKKALALKKVIDMAGSFTLLCLLSPALGLIALAIKLNSKGPVMFRQVRVGQKGREFGFWKFRSMYVDSDTAIHQQYVAQFIARDESKTDNRPIYKMTSDPRVTPVGRFLRKTSLDELPQLWNVLRGDMSLVGPRPPVPYEFECYALWHRRRVIEVKPGMTGLWQVTGRSRTTFNEMVRLDLRYVQQWSIWLDLKILLQTPKAVLLGEGAY